MRAATLCSLLCCAAAAAAFAAQPERVDLHGAVTDLALPTSSPTGAIVVGGKRVEVARDLSIELPASVTTLARFFADAPPGCVARGESGVAAHDACRSEPEGTAAAADPKDARRDADTLLSVATARLVADVRPDGQLVATRLQITRNGEPFWGGVTFVSPTDGYLRVNGALRADDGGTIVRLNDPTKQQSAQQGPGCGSAGNCSPDPRFQVALNPWSARFEDGNPACIGTDDQGCMASNRAATPGDLLTRVPIRVGDNLLMDGSFETVHGVRFFSAEALLVQVKLDPSR
jgi:hypothetical protein